MITERAKLLFTILGVSLLLAWLTQLELVYLISSVLASILLISFLIFKLTMMNLTCTRQLPQAAYEDDVIEVKVVLKNRSIFSNYFIYLMDNFPADEEGKREKKILIPFLAKRRAMTWQYDGICFKRGQYWAAAEGSGAGSGAARPEARRDDGSR